VPLNKTNILIVDDEALLRQGLRAILEKENFVGAVHEADDEATFLSTIASKKIDIILLDVRLKKISGFELINKLNKLNNTPKIIAVTGLDGIEVIINLLRAGVHGIVYKLNGYDEIRKTIGAVLQSETYYPQNILNIIQANAHRWETVPSVTLSLQEMELLKGIALGETTKQIADNLKMSPATAETYRIRLIKKIGVTNTASLLAYAFKNGIL
jgi:DNA-binding NarL/FixJ family response regulator